MRQVCKCLTVSVKARKAKIGKRNPNYKGGKSIDSNGYVTVPAPERGKGGRRKYEHRVKAKAKRGQVVHHKNNATKGIAARRDNRVSNLQRTTNHPKPSAAYWRKEWKRLGGA
jgi:hypothetical protein